MARLPAMLVTTSWATNTAHVLFWPMLVGFPVALAWVRRADAARWSNTHLMTTMLLLALGLVITVSSVTPPEPHRMVVLTGLTLYLFSFSVLEAGLTADTSRSVDAQVRGTAMGVQKFHAIRWHLSRGGSVKLGAQRTWLGRLRNQPRTSGCDLGAPALPIAPHQTLSTPITNLRPLIELGYREGFTGMEILGYGPFTQQSLTHRQLGLRS